jgi:hypothetical protein
MVTLRNVSHCFGLEVFITVTIKSAIFGRAKLCSTV